MQVFLKRDTQIEVRVSIDAAGKVTAVAPVSTENAYLTGLAVSTARQWRFEPAKRNGRPVASEVKLVFPFRPGRGANQPPPLVSPGR
jgi:TonB family protein